MRAWVGVLSLVFWGGALGAQPDPELRAISDCIRAFDRNRVIGSLGRSNRPDPAIVPSEKLIGQQRGFLVVTDSGIYRVNGLSRNRGENENAVWFALPGDDRKFFVNYVLDPGTGMFKEMVSVPHTSMPAEYRRVEANDLIDESTRTEVRAYALEALGNFVATFEALVGRDRHERSWNTGYPEEIAAREKEFEQKVPALREQLKTLTEEHQALQKNPGTNRRQLKRAQLKIDRTKKMIRDLRLDVEVLKNAHAQNLECGGYPDAKALVGRIRATDNVLSGMTKSCGQIDHPAIKKKVAAFTERWLTCRNNTAIPNFLSPTPASPGSAGETQ